MSDHAVACPEVPECPRCGADHVELIQPDVDAPDCVYARCGECRAWYFVALEGDGWMLIARATLSAVAG